MSNEKWMNPIDGIVTSCFGERNNPILNKEEFHDGIDIGAKENANVIAVKSGKVVEVKTSATYGKILQYEIQGGYKIMYAHCNKILVEEGEYIEQGQIVATVGSTGLSTGPHLHYGIIKNDEYINPLDYVDLPILKEAMN